MNKKLAIGLGALSIVVGMGGIVFGGLALLLAASLFLAPAPLPPSADAAPGAVVAASTEVASGVSVNGRALNAAQIRDLTQRYGVKPSPGAYWYDPKSGLYGLDGQPVVGLLQPGHDFGALPAQASRGTTGVFLNGRQLPVAELAVYQAALGPIRPGRYWLDATGGVGVEGNPAPVANLAQRLASSGGSPADKWLSGDEWAGEARIGGMPLTSGTWDRSGGGNHVISVDGKVLNLPPY